MPSTELCVALALFVTACGPDDASVGADAASGRVDAAPDLERLGGDGEPSAGACDNARDRLITSGEAGVVVDDEVPPCARALLSSGSGPRDADFAERISACLADATGLSPACAACHGANARCGAASCLLLCIADGEAPRCLDCRCGRTGPEDCIQGFVECSGIPDDTCGGPSD